MNLSQAPSLLRGHSPQSPFPVSPDHQSIDIPLSSINHEVVNNEATIEGKRHDPTFALAEYDFNIVLPYDFLLTLSGTRPHIETFLDSLLM
jgi:hypothetical protein